MVTAIAPTTWRPDALNAYAAAVAAQLAPARPGELRTAAARVDWIEVRTQHLAAREGRQDALLCPRARGGFVVLVDPDLSPADTAAGRDVPRAMDWRLAHELGHTYFYDRGAPSQRWSSWRPDEEDAADFFAAALLRELGISS